MERECEKGRVGVKTFFVLHRDSSRRWCEIRWDFENRPPEQRLFLQLGKSLVAVNVWLTILGADSGYSFGTIFEYAKVLLYALTWLAHKPIQLGTGHAIPLSLFSLSRADMRALFAWLDVPAKDVGARQALCQTGQLPTGYRERALSASTRNLRLATLSTFYDWLITEYMPENGPGDVSVSHPLERPERPLTPQQVAHRQDGFLPQTTSQLPRPSKLFRRHQDTPLPQALSPAELQLLFETIPQVSFGHNTANRNGALIRLSLWGMLRVSELVATTWEAVDGQVLQVCGKGRKSRLIPIVDTGTWTFLNAYTNELRLPLERRFHGALFRQIDHEEVPLTKHSVEHLILTLRAYFHEAAPTAPSPQKHLMNALAKKLHSHIFRATGATLMAAAGMDLVRLSLLLGHASPETTQRYYLAAEQLDLPREVELICRRVQEALASASSSPASGHSPLGWYERKGYAVGEKGGSHGRRRVER
jgi:site-specific recombinase XerD